ncbi:hypothetical protein [Arthrobacter sp. Bz4]|uniref:hypothetical protein n=1 Tax=Arthrobacter sp. Bz4 TaxID=2171979 RepID=UPI000D514832|nr:hypothetical protein [Arthrobacter sp. Bz4]PVE15370.1 hypothetical protein DDA93_14605 [Arthrobacter sp. Bz4]
MDRIENLIRGLDPVRAEGRANGAADSQPASEADEDAGVFSDDRPVVVPLARRRTVVLVLAGAAAAAAVAGAIVVGSSMGVQGPLPAGTTDPEPAPKPTTVGEGTADPAPEPTAVPTGPPADVGCQPQDVDRLMEQGSDFASYTPWTTNPQYYPVIGCTDEWMSMELTEEGYAVEGKDGGNAWFYIAQRVNGQWVIDLDTYGAILRWEFLMEDPNGTPQELMDQRFIEAGIPVELREELVGAGPTADELVRGLDAPELGLSYRIPLGWGIVDVADGYNLVDTTGNVVSTLMRSRESGIGGACSEPPVPWREVRSVPVSIDTPSGPVSARFAVRVFEGKQLVGASGLVLSTDPTSGEGCMVYNAISTPAVGLLSLTSEFRLSPHEEGNGTVFESIADAEAYAGSAEFDALAGIADSIIITD